MSKTVYISSPKHVPKKYKSVVANHMRSSTGQDVRFNQYEPSFHGSYCLENHINDDVDLVVILIDSKRLNNSNEHDAYIGKGVYTELMEANDLNIPVRVVDINYNDQWLLEEECVVHSVNNQDWNNYAKIQYFDEDRFYINEEFHELLGIERESDSSITAVEPVGTKEELKSILLCHW